MKDNVQIVVVDLDVELLQSINGIEILLPTEPVPYYILSDQPMRRRFSFNLDKFILSMMPLPPLLHLLGQTPLKEWINNCKPFSGTLRASQDGIEFISMELSAKNKEYIEWLEQGYKLMEEMKMKLLIKKEDNEKM